jgi:hypothetical protein
VRWDRAQHLHRSAKCSCSFGTPKPSCCASALQAEQRQGGVEGGAHAHSTQQRQCAAEGQAPRPSARPPASPPARPLTKTAVAHDSWR